MPRIPDRKGEDILDFLQREGFFQKTKTKELLKEGHIKVNGRVMKRENYKPKKGDKFEIPPWTFTVSK